MKDLIFKMEYVTYPIIMESIVFNKGMKDVAGTKPQILRLGDWFCEPLTWAKAMEMTATALLCDVRYRDRLLKNISSSMILG